MVSAGRDFSKRKEQKTANEKDVKEMNYSTRRVLNLIWISLLILVMMFGWSPIHVLAGPESQTVGSNGGLQVSNALLDLNPATPGQVYVHKMVVSLGTTAPAMDLTVEARGFGESLDGSFLPLEAAQDTSPYSGRTYITNIDKPTFHLDPGGSTHVSVTFTMPNNLDTNTHYAMIYIHSQAVVSQTGGIGQIVAVSVPVLITPSGAQFNKIGKISDLSVGPIVSGSPIQIFTTVTNTGNRHYKVNADVTINNSAGKLVTDIKVPTTSTSIIPTYAQQLIASYSALDHPNGLEAGTYTVISKAYRDDGTLLDTAQTTFVVKATLVICPGVDPNHMVVASFTDQDPGTVDARNQTGVQVTFENTGKVTGQVAICEYTQEPAGSPGFEDPPGNGGLGGKGIEFFVIRVDGFTQGTAHVAVSYQPGQLSNMDPNSLLLAIRENNWIKLDNLAVQTGAQTVIGDVLVNQLTQGPLFAMGGISSGLFGLSTPILALLGCLILIVLVLLALLIYWLFFRRKQEGKKEK